MAWGETQVERQDGPKPDGWTSFHGQSSSENDPAEKREESAGRDQPSPPAGMPSRSSRHGASSRQDEAPSAQAAQSLTQAAEAPQATAKPAKAAKAAKSASRPNPARRKPRVLLWSFLIAVFLVLSVVGGAAWYVWNGLKPTHAAQPVRVTIDRGMKAQRVAELLEQNGLIRDAWIFSGWLKLKDEGSRFQAGIYELTPGMTREQIVAKLNKGDIIAPATIRFTIPEGWTVEQMANRLAENGHFTKEDFLKAAADPANWTGSAWTSQIPLDAGLRYPLEGYLFPETYEMKTESSAVDIINRMLAELDKKLKQLPDDWQSEMQERELTLHQLLTIASLVEREVVVDEERPIVAGVIENRLKQKMPLQIDATIQYLLDKPKELLLEDLKVESPYNTYLNPGLPPGPIATPSLKSIEAALYPEETEYYYYVTKKDGTNTHLFATTLKQHQRNIEQSNKNAKK